MLRQTKDLLRKSLNNAGVEIRKNPYLDPVKLQKHLLANAEPTIFDVGAYIGTTAIEYRQHFPDAHIHAFEPYPESFSQLVRATASDPRIYRHAMALGREPGKSSLKVNTAKATNSLLDIADGAGELWGEGRLESQNHLVISVDSVDNFCLVQKIENINLLKMDVQGLEYDVLIGSEKMLDSQSIDLVYQEVLIVDTYSGQRPLADYLSFMTGKNYELIDFFEPMRRNGRLLQMDILYASRRLLDST